MSHRSERERVGRSVLSETPLGCVCVQAWQGTGKVCKRKMQQKVSVSVFVCKAAVKRQKGKICSRSMKFLVAVKLSF